jgi:hypothetical protein
MSMYLDLVAGRSFYCKQGMLTYKVIHSLVSETSAEKDRLKLCEPVGSVERAHERVELTERRVRNAVYFVKRM